MASSQFGSFERRPHCVDNEVGRDLFAFHSANAGDVRDFLRSRRACQQTHDAGATTDGEEPFGDTCDRILDRGAATRDRYESFIALSRRAIGDGRGHSRKHIEPCAADPEQSLFHVWQMGIEEMAYGRVQVMRLPELSYPSPFPRVPCFLGRAGKRLAVAFENGDVMALPSQHHRHRKPDNTAA
jgi:hypothetical protein